MTAPAAALAKALTGISGFDEITDGGLPRGRASLFVGGPGCGKTVFALQTLVNGARRWKEPGVFVAFEESSRQIVANANTLGWNLAELEKEQLFFLDAKVSPDTIKGGAFDLSALIAGLRAKVEAMGARRIVFDGIDVLLTLLDDPVAERRELYRLNAWLVESELTAIVTAKTDDGPNRFYGPMHFMVDCVVVLRHELVERVSLREVQVLKYRGSAFAENAVPFCIGADGVQVADPGLREITASASSERVSTGVERLDTMLAGGYYRGSSILISGHPGTAKSTLSGTFVEAACSRGERALYVTFDESDTEIVRNLRSVSIRLGPHVASGLLRIVSVRPESRSAEEHLIRLTRLISTHDPRCVVIDSLSALIKAGGFQTALGVAQRLVRLVKATGVTLVCTSLLEANEAETEGTVLQVSTIADTWIHLSYNVRGGERNRALTVVKARGTNHSNQVRELILDTDGVTLTDVYCADGEVLMGTARWEREVAVSEAAVRAQTEQLRKRRELLTTQADLKARMETLARQLEVCDAEMSLLEQSGQARGAAEEERRRALMTLRKADSGQVAAPERTRGQASDAVGLA